MDVDSEGERAAQTPGDERLTQRLAEMFAADDGPPPGLTDWAKAIFGLRTVDAELAAITADSYTDELAVAVRADETAQAPRLLTFEAPALAVEVEIGWRGGRRRVFGHLVPPGPASIELRHATAPAARTSRADDAGRFEIENVLPGPISLLCRVAGRPPVVTEWIGVD